MHSGLLSSSKRLQDTLKAMQPAGVWHSTRDIAVKTGSMAVHSDIAALKANGVHYVKRQKGKIVEYCLCENLVEVPSETFDAQLARLTRQPDTPVSAVQGEML